MVGFIFLNSLLDAKTTIEVDFATLLLLSNQPIRTQNKFMHLAIDAGKWQNGFPPSLRIG